MERARRIAVVTAHWFLGVALALALSLAFLFYTGPGNSALASLIGWLSGGNVAVTGLSGDLPNAPRAELVEVSDGTGVWLRIEDVSVAWNAFAAIGSHIDIQEVRAARIAVLRKPISEEESEGSTPEIDISSLHAPRIEIAKAVAGHAAVLGARGSLHYVSRHQVQADLAVMQLDGAGRYRIKGGIVDDIALGTATITEDRRGILGALLGLPGLGAINLSAAASGDVRENRVVFALAAGDLKAEGSGTIALASRRADIDFVADAPKMSPSPEIAWRLVVLEGHMHGAFDAPRLDGRLTISDGFVSGIRTAEVVAQVGGDSGVVDLTGTARGLRIPGKHPDLFAGAPVSFSAHADLKASTRPVRFRIGHPLLALDGSADTLGTTKLALTATVPALEPFAGLAGQDLRGSARLTIDAQQTAGRTQFAATGRVDAQGASVLARVLGRNASFSLHAVLNGADIERSDAAITGAAIDFRSSGTLRAKTLDYGMTVKLPDVSRLSSALIGSAALSGRVLGPLGTAATTVNGTAVIASKGFEPRRIDLGIQAKGFPGISSGRLRASGSLNGAPVSLRGDFARQANGATASASAKWKSLDAQSDFVLPPKAPATGKARIDVAVLADVAPLLGLSLTGSLAATVALETRGRVQTASLRAQASRVAMADAALGTATVEGTIADPFGTPSLALDVTARQIAVSGFEGDAQARLNGPLRSLAISAKAAADDDRSAQAEARLDAEKKKLLVMAAAVEWRGETAVLASPATVDYADGLAVDHLAATLGGGRLTLSGRLQPRLAATASLRNIDAAMLQPFVATRLSGSLSGDAQLGGTPEEPRGTLDLHARDLIAADYLPRTPIGIDVQGALHGRGMTLDGKITGGSGVTLALNGEAPLRADAPMRLHARGNADLAMLNPFVAAEGRRLRGALALDADVSGTMAAPRITGSGTVKDGDLQDYARGVRLHAIDAAFSAEGQVLRITRLSARAGPGTMSGSGSIDLAGPGIPLDVTLEVKNARPIASDLLTATLSGSLRVSGAAKKTVTVSGKLDVARGTIDIPDRFPPEIAVLDVRRKGQGLAKPAPSGGSVALDIAVATSGPVFVRGRGIDADMGGDLHLGGTTAAPVATGGFTMNRGTVTLAGQTLTFTSGKLGFDGAGIRNRIDPSLDLAAQTSSGGVTATLAVTGHASAPRIVLSSSPSLPQDEVLARLFFQQSAKQLTPLQLAQIAQAIASLGGIGNGFDPLGALRRGLRLDRLSVGSSTGGASGSESQTTVEGGKYVARNIYVGAKQSLSGSAQVQVQIDLTKQLKAQATVSTGTNATVTKGSAGQDNGSSVGLSYEFEY